MRTAVVVADVIDRELAFGKGKKNITFVSLEKCLLENDKGPPNHVVSVIVRS